MSINRKRDDFLRHIKDFDRNRQAFAEIWKIEEPNFSMLIDRQSLLIAPDVSGLYSSSLQQANLRGQPIRDIGELYKSAATAKSAFETIVTEIVDSSGIRSDAIVRVSLKTQESTIDKADFNYSIRKPSPSISWVYDIVRCSIVCDTPEEICALLESLDYYEGVEVVRLKNRFASPTCGGYRDILLNIRVPISEEFLSYHICEIQIHYRPFFDASVKLASHSIYEYFRTYFRSAHYVVTPAEQILRCELLLRIPSLVESQQIESYVDRIISQHDILSLDPLQQSMRRLGEYSLAERIQRDVVTQTLSSYGSNECDERVLTALHGLMTILEHQNSLVEAENICRRLVIGREKAYGKQDIRTVKIVNNLGVLLSKQKKYEEAESYLLEALKLKEELLGTKHQSTLTTMDSLADLLKSLNKFQEAEKICEKTLEARIEMLGREHPLTISSMNNLAVMQKKVGALKESEVLFTSILQMKCKSIGRDHQSTLNTADNLASVLEEMQVYPEAIRLYYDNLKIREHLLGETHMDTITNIINLGNTYYRNRQYAHSSECFHRASVAMDVVLGPEHVKTKQAEKRAKDCLVEWNKDINVKSKEDAKVHIEVNVVGPGAGRQFEKCTKCENCGDEYTVIKREHHCRYELF